MSIKVVNCSPLGKRDITTTGSSMLDGTAPCGMYRRAEYQSDGVYIVINTNHNHVVVFLSDDGTLKAPSIARSAKFRQLDGAQLFMEVKE